MSGADLMSFMHSVVGSTAYARLPVPTQWNAVDRPHVALLNSTNDMTFRFLMSNVSPEDNQLSVMDLGFTRTGTMVEVRHSALDYRYYRRDGEIWLLVARVRNRFLMEIYDRPGSPVLVPLSGAHVFASD
jgi:hypothetical protein